MPSDGTEGVVVRFAPSPTGPFHVGSARTALYNWMWARRTGGRFLLRIEDTDTSRSTPESLENILSNLALLGLQWDGEVHYSSANRTSHLAAATALVGAGLAYRCDCSRSDVDARGVSVGSGYDGFCRDRSVPSEGAVVRFRNPGGPVTFDDAVLGTNTTDATAFGDFPLVKSNGDPLFLLGNVVDDALTGVTWVVRGADHLPNNPRYVLLWEALAAAGFTGRPLPRFAHLPLIVGPSGKKLSKRRDRVAVDALLQEDGILPSALLTYLSGLGWGAPDGMDKLPVPELVEHFDLFRVGANNAVMDPVKLRAVNAAHLGALYEEDPTAFVSAVLSHLGTSWDLLSHPDLVADLPSRIAVLEDARALLAPVFADVPLDDRAATKWLWSNVSARPLLEGFTRGVAQVPWEAGSLHSVCEEISAAEGLSMLRTTMPVRVAALRTDRGMPLFTALDALGREQTLVRVGSALSQLGS